MTGNEKFDNDAGRVRARLMKENSKIVGTMLTKNNEIREKLLSLSEKIENVFVTVAETNPRDIYNSEFDDLTMAFEDVDIMIIPHKKNDLKITDRGDYTFAFDIPKCNSMKIFDEESDWSFLTTPHKLIQISRTDNKTIFLYYNEKQ